MLVPAWANSVIAVLEAVRKLFKQQTFEDVVDIFGQREWYPRDGHCNAAVSVMHVEVTPPPFSPRPPTHARTHARTHALTRTHVRPHARMHANTHTHKHTHTPNTSVNVNVNNKKEH